MIANNSVKEGDQFIVGLSQNKNITAHATCVFVSDDGRYELQSADPRNHIVLILHDGEEYDILEPLDHLDHRFDPELQHRAILYAQMRRLATGDIEAYEEREEDPEIDGLLQQLQDSQGPGDRLIQIGPMVARQITKRDYDN